MPPLDMQCPDKRALTTAPAGSASAVSNLGMTEEQLNNFAFVASHENRFFQRAVAMRRGFAFDCKCFHAGRFIAEKGWLWQRHGHVLV